MVDAWGWIVAYAAALVLFQVLVYRYLWRRGGTTSGESLRRWYDEPRERADGRRRARSGSGSGSRSRSGAGPGRGPEGDGRGEDAAGRERPVDPLATPGVDVEGVASGPGGRDGPAVDDGRRCPHCGADNEPDETFTRCWRCAGAL